MAFLTLSSARVSAAGVNDDGLLVRGGVCVAEGLRVSQCAQEKSAPVLSIPDRVQQVKVSRLSKVFFGSFNHDEDSSSNNNNWGKGKEKKIGM